MKKSAAIYTRVSTDRQKEQCTIDSQKTALLEYAQSHEYIVRSEWIFEDDGYSGAVLVRPGLERLRDLAAEGQIETILIYAPDRLSRKYAYQVLLVEEFSRCGVETRFIKSPSAQTPEEHLLLQFQGMIAEYERAQIAERTRRGRRHRAKQGSVSVLSTAPYGYRYVKKTEHSQAYFVVQESEAEVVRKIFNLYTRESWSIAAIARHLNEQKVQTRCSKTWQPTTIWGMLHNPAYQGRAAFGKTQNCPSQKITRATRQRGGVSRRLTNKEVDRSQWIEIAVPALVSAETFALAQEHLAHNRQLSLRNTKEPSLLQSLLVCQQCGYSYYRSSTSKGRERRFYYRCGGTDQRGGFRHTACSARMIRLDYLDDLVWCQILEMLRCPDLIRAEMERRRLENLNSNPVQQRKEQLDRELSRTEQQMDRLLDAYQEGLVALAELRERAPVLKKRMASLENEKTSLEARAIDQQRWRDINQSLDSFLTRLNQTAQNLTPAERQKIVRLLVKQIDVAADAITIHHSIPIDHAQTPSNIPPAASSQLYMRRQSTANGTNRDLMVGRVALRALFSR
jgi:site-specific DNA recombinase